MLKLSSSSPPPPERNSWGDQPVEREFGGCSHHPRLGLGSSSFSLGGLRSVVLEYPPLSVSRGAAPVFPAPRTLQRGVPPGEILAAIFGMDVASGSLVVT